MVSGYKYRMLVLNCRHRIADDGSKIGDMVKCTHKHCRYGLSEVDHYAYVFPKDKRKNPPF